MRRREIAGQGIHLGPQKQHARDDQALKCTRRSPGISGKELPSCLRCRTLRTRLSISFINYECARGYPSKMRGETDWVRKYFANVEMAVRQVPLLTENS